MDVFDRAERFLPELKVDEGIELGEAGVEMVLEGIGIGQVDRMWLVGVLGYTGKVQAESLLETAKLDAGASNIT